MYCSPHLQRTLTCYTYSELIEIATSINIYSIHHNHLPIIDITLPKMKLWQSIYNVVSCESEYCWLDKKFIDNIYDKHLRYKLLNHTFKPKIQKQKYSWLTTIDIDSVLQQYQLKIHSFNYIGAVPCDFYKLDTFDYISNFDKKYFDSVAIVFNLDTFNKPGSHWVSLFVDNISNTIEYFDSLGNPPNACISQFISNLLFIYDNTYTFRYNSVVHQRKSSECGVYSIYFIIQRLNLHSFNDIVSKPISDDVMNSFRKSFFRPAST